MEISATFSTPIRLVDGTKNNLIYNFSVDDITSDPGCYIFYNKHGDSISNLYIGKASRLKERLIQQRKNNVSLMMGIKNSLNGQKYLTCCYVNLKKGQKLQKVIRMLESNLIKIALTNGDELLNIQGARVKYSHIHLTGNISIRKFFGKTINVVGK